MKFLIKDFEKDVIYIDSREGNRRTVFKNYFENDFNMKYEVVTNRQLPYGDYMYNDCVFEYKTLKDCIDSIKNEKSFEQARAMQKSDFKSINFIIVGQPNLDNISEHISYVQWRTRIEQTMPVHIAENEWIASKIMEKTFRTYDDGVGIPRKFKDHNYNVGINILDSLHSCSSKNAVKIFEEHQINTIGDLFTLNVDNLKQIKGIGEATAIKIYCEINGISKQMAQKEKNIKEKIKAK